MKVTSTRDIDFPTLGWSIQAGEEKELPDNKEAQDAILASEYITKVPASSKAPEKTTK